MSTLKVIAVATTIVLQLTTIALACDAQKDGKQQQLEDDIKLMWQTHKRSDGSSGASTSEAVKAARRVFEKVDLIGMTRSQVVEKLGDPQKVDGSYFKYSAREVEAGTLFYRFDTGIYGWQFNVLFDDQSKVREVKRRLIE